jgi:hypothetical protein
MLPKLIVLLHIYKTGGQTLHHNLRLNLPYPLGLPLYVGPMGLDVSKATGSLANPGWQARAVNAHVARRLTPDTRVMYGHMAYFGLHHWVEHPVEPRYAVFFRDPVERVISLYYYLRDMSQNHWHHELREAGWDIEAWLERSRALWHLNGQIRQLLLGMDDSVEHVRDLSRDHLEAAKRRLRKFWFIGLMETFHTDAHFLYHHLRFRKFNAEAQMNANPAKPRVPAAMRQTIAEHNALGVELYAYARQLREAWLRAHWPEYRLGVWSAALRRRLYVWRQRERAPAGPGSSR